jgi:hypothetical protein
MQLIQNRLQTRQNATIEVDRERALETRLVLRLVKQPLQFDQFDLQVQFPRNHSVNIFQLKILEKRTWP